MSIAIKSLSNGLAALTAGGIFGYALNQGKVNIPGVITAFFALKNFTMLRMFLAAASTSTAVALVLQKHNEKRMSPKAGRSLMSVSFLANFIGGVLLGAGMYISGSCPGTVWSQIGAGMPNTIYVIAGGIVGVLAYGYAEPKMSLCKHEPSKFIQWGLVPFFGMLAVVYATDQMFPWQEEMLRVVPDSEASFNLFANVWDPALAGVVVGLLQLPLMLSKANGLGASSGWTYFSSHVACAIDCGHLEKTTYFHNAKTDEKAIWQAISSIGIILGSALSQYNSNYPSVNPELFNGMSPMKSFVGGILVLFGSRLAQGCTSGSGLTGMATRSLASLVTVCGMFAGGLTLGQLLPPV